MTNLRRVLIGLAVIAALGAAFYFLVDQLSAKAKEIGLLENAQAQLSATLESQKVETAAARRELDMWRGLYTDLQDGYQQVDNERKAMRKKLAALKEQPDVQAYMACPMPDELYQWLRNN